MGVLANNIGAITTGGLPAREVARLEEELAAEGLALDGDPAPRRRMHVLGRSRPEPGKAQRAARLAASAAVRPLTRKQFEAAARVAAGYTQAQTAEQLGITQQAVSLRLVNAWRRLGIEPPADYGRCLLGTQSRASSGGNWNGRLGSPGTTLPAIAA